MKKILALLLVLVMMLCVVACTPAENQNPTESTPATEGTEGTEGTENNNDNTSTAMTHAEYLAAAEDDAVEIECYVQATQSWWDNQIVIYAQDKDGGYFAYNVACTEDEAATLVPGTKINIKGYKTFYKGMPEVAAGATFTVVEGADIYVAEAQDMTSLLGSEDLVKNAGMKALFKGLTIEKIEYKNGEPGDDIYVDVSLDGNTYSFCVEVYLTGTDTDVYKAFADLQVGDKVDIEGFVYWYDGINTHITGVSAAE